MDRALDTRHDEAPMSRTDCPSQDTLSDFVLGKLAILDQGPVAEHLDVCRECRKGDRKGERGHP
jgi:hypothetical protein